MKKKKVFVTFGAIVLMLGLAMNVQYALADYGIETNSLPIMVLAQSGGGGGSTSGSDHGHQESESISCSIETIYGSTTNKHTISGTKYWCKGDNFVEVCVNYDPCSGFYQ